MNIVFKNKNYLRQFTKNNNSSADCEAGLVQMKKDKNTFADTFLTLIRMEK